MSAGYLGGGGAAGAFGGDTGGGGDGGDDWMGTYADAITLLMAFFVMMFSVSKLDGRKFDEVQQSIATHVSRRQASPTPFQGFLPQIEVAPAIPSQNRIPTEQSGEPVTKAKTKGEPSTQLGALAKDGLVAVERKHDGIVVEFSSSAMYLPGSSNMDESIYAALDEVVQAIDALGFEPEIDIEGHTDDTPIRTARYPSNWELSASRAANVAKYFPK